MYRPMLRVFPSLEDTAQAGEKMPVKTKHSCDIAHTEAIC